MSETTCSQCGAGILWATSQRTGGLCRPCQKRKLWHEKATQADSRSPEQEEWTLDPSSSHQRARGILVESFFWDCADENSPLGNDTGSDTLAFFRDWRRRSPTGSIATFVESLLAAYEVTHFQLDPIPDGQMQAILERDGYHIVTFDDTLIAVAFAQGILEGEVDPEFREQALKAIRREASSAVIAYRGWVDPDERRNRLDLMRAALLRF